MLDRASMTRAFDQIEKALGTVTILVNNAGVAHSTRATDVTEEEWRRVVGTNLDAVFFRAQEAAKRMLAAGKKGAIVNIASVLGFGVSKGTIAYSTAKAGVIQMTKALGLELAFKGVRVNAIAPGWFVTEINHDYLDSEQGRKLTRDIPVGRFGQDGDLDGALLLLVSDAGSYMAGATIVVDGGQMVALRGDIPQRDSRTVAGEHRMDFTLSARESRTSASAPAPSSRSMCCRWKATRRISPSTRTSRTSGSPRCARRQRRPGCGRRSRPRNTAAWTCRSSPGR